MSVCRPQRPDHQYRYQVTRSREHCHSEAPPPSFHGFGVRIHDKNFPNSHQRRRVRRPVLEGLSVDGIRRCSTTLYDPSQAVFFFLFLSVAHTPGVMTFEFSSYSWLLVRQTTMVPVRRETARLGYGRHGNEDRAQKPAFTGKPTCTACGSRIVPHAFKHPESL